MSNDFKPGRCPILVEPTTKCYLTWLAQFESFLRGKGVWDTMSPNLSTEKSIAKHSFLNAELTKETYFLDDEVDDKEKILYHGAILNGVDTRAFVKVIFFFLILEHNRFMICFFVYI